MKNIQPNANNFQKNRLTELPVTIVTDDTHKEGDQLELTRQRIEKAALYLMSVFNLLKTCAVSSEGQADNKEVATFCGDVMNHCDIGYGISDSILASASALTEFIPDEKAEIETATAAPDLANFWTDKYRETGERIERVLASEKVSRKVKNILEALVAEAAIEAGFSIPDTEDIAGKFPKIFDRLGKSKSPFVCYYSAIETALNHGTSKTDE
jgi:hypothetical protein